MSQLDHLPHPQRLPSLNHHTLSFFPSDEDARMAASELVNLGFSESDILIFEGDEGAEAIDLAGNQGDWLDRYYKKFVKFSDSAEWYFLLEADNQLRQGHVLMCLITNTEVEKNKVVPLLKRHQGYGIRYVSGLYVEEI